MGGGTGFTSIPTKTLEDAEKIFRNATQKIEASSQKEGRPSRNVFISFHVEDEAQVNLLRAQAKREEFGLEFRDYSVKEPFDEKWKKQVSERISITSATIVMIGPDTASRPAVNFEIEESFRQGKKVIGVRIYRDKNYPIPQGIIQHRAPIVDWRMEDIQRELDKP